MDLGSTYNSMEIEHETKELKDIEVGDTFTGVETFYYAISPDFVRTALTLTEIIEKPIITVDIDVQPKSTKNNVRLNTNNLLPVAIMGSAAYDISQVNPDSVTFEGASPVRPAKFKDLNGDGMPDMMFKFAIQDTSIECGDNEATLSGQTWDGLDVTGTDSINTVRCE
jgi:hypothetical protein